MEDLMTRKTIAAHFKVSQRTIERWEKAGMPVIKIGQVRRYDVTEIRSWLIYILKHPL